MRGIDPNAFSLNVDTSELTRVLKRLLRHEPRTKLVQLKYESETLAVSIGSTSLGVRATGTWSQPVSVGRTWAEALAANPMEAAITDLRLADGKLHTRDFVVSCSLAPSAEESEELVKREEDLDEASQILARFNVTKREVSVLIADADSERSRLWAPGDGRLIDDIAEAWKQLAIDGVEPSDIRRLIDRKSRELWKSGRKSNADGYSPLAHYNVTKREVRALIEAADPAKAALWQPHHGWLVDDIAQAWKRLAIDGVEPSDIRRLINRKSH
jgi:hypothetical protein